MESQFKFYFTKPRGLFSSRVYSDPRSNTTYNKQHIFNRELVSTVLEVCIWGFLSTSFSNVYIAFKEFQIFSSLSKIRSFQTFLNQIVSDLFKSDLFRSFQIRFFQVFSDLFKKKSNLSKHFKIRSFQIFLVLFRSFQK